MKQKTPDRQVCEAYRDANYKDGVYSYDLLIERTGQCLKVACCAMERSLNRGYIDAGVSIRTGWLTDKGKALLDT